MENYDINTVGRDSVAQRLDAAIESWKWFGNMNKESFSAVDKTYDPVQEMLIKEHDKGLEMMSNPDISDEARKDASQHVREAREAAQAVASNRMADVLKIVGGFVTVAVAALGGVTYVKSTR